MNSGDYDALARLLDGDLPNGEATAEARALGALAQTLAASARVPQMEHKPDLRAMLVEAAREQAAAPSLLSRFRESVDNTTARWRYSVRLAAATGASAMALSTGGVALAAHRATPSEPVFYSVKLAYEDVRVAMIGDPVERGKALLAYAEQRLAEAEVAAAAGDMEAARRALAEADANSRAGAGYIIKASQEQGDPSLLAILDDFAGNHRKRLTALLPLLRGDAAGVAEDAMIGLRRISQRLAVLSGPCGRCDYDTAGKTKGRKSRAEQVAASNPDFDFSHIPPASEPFAACPCVTDDGNTGTADRARNRADKAKSKAKAKGKKDVVTEPTKAGSSAVGSTGGSGDAPADEDPGDDTPSGETPGGEEPGDDPVDTLPEPVRKPVKDAEKVVKDVIENPPTPLPTPDLPDVPDLPDAPDLP